MIAAIIVLYILGMVMALTLIWDEDPDQLRLVRLTMFLLPWPVSAFVLVVLIAHSAMKRGPK